MRIDRPGKEQVPQLLQLWKDVFGDCGGFWELFLDTAFLPDHCRCVMEKSLVTAALYWFDCSCQGQRQAYVYAVVTRPEYRGRGLCRKLLENTHAHLASLGYSAVLLVPEKESLRQMYRRLGYRDCTSVSEFSCTAGDRPASLRTIGAEAYGKLRRNFLPANGALQEGEALAFLAAQAQLYAGQDFLLAAYADEGGLHGMELLGNREAAPGILRALGFDRGTFRGTGEAKPFAMFHPLTENAAVPAYLGLAFD